MKVAIVGSGNVATHLNRALVSKVAVSLVNPHTLHDLPLDCDIILLCIADDAISIVASKIPKSEALMAHTSGSVGLDTLRAFSPDCGVLYPLQTFTKDVALDYKEIPVFIEASSQKNRDKLRHLAGVFTEKIYDADSLARKQLHLASVFACNFTNALIGIGEELIREAGMDFSILLPLLHQTIDKLDFLTPEQAQTGPAKRGDNKVIQNHLSMLAGKKDLMEIYRLISIQIGKRHSSSMK